MYPLALLVFFASILVPMFKLIALVAMLLATQIGRPEAGRVLLLRERTMLYYIVAWVGRWSMVDIFGNRCWARARPVRQCRHHPARHRRSPFCAVVFITIFAAAVLDPRLLMGCPPPPPISLYSRDSRLPLQLNPQGRAGSWRLIPKRTRKAYGFQRRKLIVRPPSLSPGSPLRMELLCRPYCHGRPWP